MCKSVFRPCGMLFLLLLTACASSGGSTATQAARGNRNLLTQEQIAGSSFKSAYEVVETLRSNWLRTRGRQTLQGKDAEVLVYLNDTKMGGVDQLRTLPTSTITYIQWYDGITAAGRWGLDHGAGVIYVSTRGTAP